VYDDDDDDDDNDDDKDEDDFLVKATLFKDEMLGSLVDSSQASGNSTFLRNVRLSLYLPG
jgi:hypothetical protein